MKNSNKRHPKAYRLITLSVLAALIGIATPYGMYSDGQPNAAAQPITAEATENQPVNGQLQKGTPDYDTVLPEGKSIKDYGGWTRVSPPNRDPVFAYADKIGAIPINVSQQPLPKDFADQPDQQIQQFAAGYAANKKLNVNGATAYIGTSAKGPQSVIVVKGDLLILIKASAAVPDSEWEQYIQSLS